MCRVQLVMSDSDQDKNAATASAVKPEKKKKIIQRRGHRAYVTKITKVSTHCAKADPDETDRVPLAGYEVSVQLKLDTLSLLDDEIIELISEEDEIEKEIVHSARYSATSKEH